MNKTKTQDYIRKNIIEKYETHQNLSSADFDFMLNMLQRHQNAEEKIGLGIKRMWLEKTRYGDKCFYLERLDGSRTDFSFLKCFSKTSLKSDYLQACRKAVEYIVIDYRDAIFDGKETVVCPILGINITKHESHVDHDLPYPFIIIAKMFYEENSLDLKTIKYTDGIGTFFADGDLKRKWVDFHNKYAKLRVISAIANQKITKQTWII